MAIAVFGYLWNRRRFGGIYKTALKSWKLREVFSNDEWKNYQEAELQKLLQHAVTTVPFYRQAFESSGLTHQQLSTFTLADLHRLPYLEKSALRSLGESRLLSSKREPGGEFFSSSGSTGTPTKILFSPRMHQAWSAAFEARIRHWAGVTIATPRGTIGGRRIVEDGDSKGPFYRYNFIEKQTYFSAYHISRKAVRNYVEGMIKGKVEYMTGYAMSNYFLARFIEEEGIQAPNLKAVITSSEKLTQEMRETFRRVYGCDSYDGYSGVEACGLVSECSAGSLHISPDVGIIELIKTDGNPAQPGEEGEAVCTGLLNYDQPLIRYRIGDVLRLSKVQECSCKVNMPIVDEIVGRVEDTVIGVDGREMVRFHGIFVDLPGVVEGQVIQHTINEFEIKLVTTSNVSPEIRKTLETRMISQLGPINLAIIEVAAIPRNQNGKFKAIISYVKRPA
ncbi:MAG: hypothetical protein Q7T76_08515 [Ferruginibacter sp.]|nr:hypothetical protein [Ferruginibacter sp.]